MILMIDNYDSFTYNLVQYLGELGQDVRVARNDELSVEQIFKLAPERIVISPGPGTPDQAGVSLQLIQKLGGQIPLLGVCLGHQSIGQVFGGKVVRAAKIMHGKTSMIQHTGKGVFAALPNPFVATRYHSLIVEKSTLPSCLEVTAWTQNDDGSIDEIMGLRHRTPADRGRPVSSGIDSHPAWACPVAEFPAHSTPRRVTGTFMSITPQQALQRTIEHREIFQDEMVDLMRQIMRGEVSPLMVAAILTGLRVKKETVGEIAAAASVMREMAASVHVPPYKHFVDIVGTGGDSTGTFNISTASMFVAAAAGARVAKHGNRSVSSKSGSADVLEAFGAVIDLAPEQVALCLEETGIGFMFAPNHHPAMKVVAPVRKEMGVRTLFNILGPLTNPAGAPNILMGVFHAGSGRHPGTCFAAARREPRTGRLGTRWHGRDNAWRRNPVGELRGDEVHEYEIHPRDFGLASASSDAAACERRGANRACACSKRWKIGRSGARHRAAQCRCRALRSRVGRLDRCRHRTAPAAR